MIKIDSLPARYIAFDSLLFCSNKLNGGVNIISINDALPLLIGKGDKPLVWIQALENEKTSSFRLVVEASIPTDSRVRVYEEDGVLIVEAKRTTVLAVRVTGESSAEVERVDLRPFGINVHGAKAGLTVGTSTFARNTVNGGTAFIALGK